MTDTYALFGTGNTDIPAENIQVGELSFTLQNGALRHVMLGDKELIRGISFLVRDRDWGTLAPTLTELERHHEDGSIRLSFSALYRNGDATLEVSLSVYVDANGLKLSAEGRTDKAFETNRAGFTALHPASLAGCEVAVLHSDQSVESTRFPTLIEPWQPFKNICSLTHVQNGLSVCCEFQGDVFEMEDQRQWGDASYKTYVRPLALPWPYSLQPGEVLQQSLCLSWRPDANSVAPGSDAPLSRNGPADGRPDLRSKSAGVESPLQFPETALLLTAEDSRRLVANTADITAVSPQRLLCHIENSAGDLETQIKSFATLQATLPSVVFDAEIVCEFVQSPTAELSAIRHSMEAHNFRPDSVMICPAADRQSTPPGSDWPDCPTLESIHEASAEVFADTRRGGGMVSFFPELNRKRPPLELLDFVSHGLCPTVHAADDLSVMETLEAIPHITRSARAILGDREYRIGPCTIAMRQNPYGQRTIPNPDLHRLCMTDDDPRHRAQFGAAYVIGLATALAPAGVSVWTPAAVYGPRGLSGPIVTALAALSAAAGKPVRRARIHKALATLQLGDSTLQANLSERPQAGLAAYEWTQTFE